MICEDGSEMLSTNWKRSDEEEEEEAEEDGDGVDDGGRVHKHSLPPTSAAARTT